MRRALRFLVPLLIVLCVLAWGTSALTNTLSHRWFERDINRRSMLAVRSAREALSNHWRTGDRERILRTLTVITLDDRIMAAAACGADLAPMASTPGYPRRFGCAAVGARVRTRTADGSGQHRLRPWSHVGTIRGGRVQVNAIPLRDDGEALGFVVLVHDLSHIDSRESLRGAIGLAALVVLAIVASFVTLLVERISWRSWTAEVRRSLAAGTGRREFLPILRDIRELVGQLAAETEAGGRGPWSPERLRSTLRRHLHGEKVVIVANREPYIHDRTHDGTVRVLHPASGLVTALEPVMRACSGVWVAHGSGSADRETADRLGRLSVPPDEGSYLLRRVWLSAEEEKGYYYGFSNEGLWPLSHIAHTRPIFRAEDFAHYQKVNERFAETVVSEVNADDPIVFVQDYHFALLPRMLRERLPRATILTFWHIPWPNSERLGICPWHRELLEGLLGSSIIGFQTQQHCNNLVDSVDRFLEARIDREQQGVVLGGRLSLVRSYPISIEWPYGWGRTAPSAAECRQSVLRELNLPENTLLGVGVDRLDYTKGIEERLLAVERVLERFPEFKGRLTFVQLAAPSRTAIDRYQELSRNVEQAAARINERFGTDRYRPIILRCEHHEPPTVVRYYRASDFCYVSSLHDGMNLVAKEFVAARDDERGALILSCFTGAARELTEALVVSPYDLDMAASAIATALTMSADEQAARMRAMRLYLAEFNVYRWAGRMIVDAARLRERERLSDRLLEPVRPVESGAT